MMKIDDIPVPSVDELNRLLDSGSFTLIELRGIADAFLLSLPDTPKYRKIKKFLRYIGKRIKLRLKHEPFVVSCMVIWAYADYLLVRVAEGGKLWLMEIQYGEIRGAMFEEESNSGDFKWENFKGSHDVNEKEKIRIGYKDIEDKEEWDW
ncbi:MAG: hypothetical protein QXL94_03085 [Candidatus Parvarchaeum sp.]